MIEAKEVNISFPLKTKIPSLSNESIHFYSDLVFSNVRLCITQSKACEGRNDYGRSQRFDRAASQKKLVNNTLPLYWAF